MNLTEKSLAKPTCPGNDENGVYADLHIHIGRARGKAVKITASRSLELKSIIYKDAPLKGLGIVGIVDMGSCLVSSELEEMIAGGDLAEIQQGGFLARNGVLLVAGSEVESREGVHLISYLPDLNAIKTWQKFLQPRVHNMELSTPRVRAGFHDIMKRTLDLQGIFCPAHAFTPHKGAYGIWTDRLVNQIGSDIEQIQALEIGLSADTDMVDRLEETGRFTCLSNSDAHSSPNIGREFNQLSVKSMNFNEICLCLQNKDGRRVLANYGMHPQLGKYHRTYCPACEKISEEEPPVSSCKVCGNSKIVMGVLDRITAIQDYDRAHHPQGRPPYYYRVPLKDLPGIGPRMYNKLLNVFSNEIELMEQIPIPDIMEAAGRKAAQAVYNMRCGRLTIIPGGGGKYGKVSMESDRW